MATDIILFVLGLWATGYFVIGSIVQEIIDRKNRRRRAIVCRHGVWVVASCTQCRLESEAQRERDKHNG